jgi:hypothetical protein
MRARILVAIIAAISFGYAAQLNALPCGAMQSQSAQAPHAKTATAQPAKTARAEDEKSEDPTKKLGAFLGKWETEGTFASGQKTSTSLECRWSPQGAYLVCDQVVRMAGEHRQFTVYSYNSKDGSYSYTTLADPGAKPSTGEIKIEGNLWTYDSSFSAGGKTTLIRTTNEFLDARPRSLRWHHRTMAARTGKRCWKAGRAKSEIEKAFAQERVMLRMKVLCETCASQAGKYQ